MHLARSDIADLTGAKHKRKQIAWLVQNGYPFEVDSDGWPKVMTAYHEARMMGDKSERHSGYEPSRRTAADPAFPSSQH